MNKLLMIAALITFSISSIFASSTNDKIGLKVLLNNASKLQLTNSSTDQTKYLSTIMAEWMTSDENETVEISNKCKSNGKCTLQIKSTQYDIIDGSYESSLILDYSVDLKNEKMKEGYNLQIAG